MVKTGRKIGIMGGTFDPIHIGHLQLGEYAYRQFQLDEVWFMPTGQSYCKEGQQVTPKEIRGEMVAAAVSRYPYFHFSDLEIRREGQTYTADTIKELREDYPDDTFYYIVGADSLMYMDQWFSPEIIFEQAEILVAKRDSVPAEQLRQKMLELHKHYHAKIWLMDFKEITLSSSQIREQIRKSGHVPHQVPGRAAVIIRREKLYPGME